MSNTRVVQSTQARAQPEPRGEASRRSRGIVVDVPIAQERSRRGHHITHARQYRFSINSDEEFTQTRMENTFLRIKQQLVSQGFNGYISCAAYIREWQAWSSIIQAHDLLGPNRIIWSNPNSDPYDLEQIKKFTVFFWGNQDAGGDDPRNNCLWNSIRTLTNYRNLPILYPSYFKKRLGLSAYDKVPLACMPRVEDLLKINIDCNSYTSPRKYSETITLKLENDHYSPLIDPSRSYLKGFCFKKRDIVFMRSREQEDSSAVYELENRGTFTAEEYKAYYKSEQIDKNNITIVPLPKDYSFSEFRIIYDEFKQLLKTGTASYNTWLDLDTCPSTQQCTLSLFKLLSASYGVMEPVSLGEDAIIKQAAHGGLHHAVPGTYDNCYELDINGMYSFIMRDLALPMSALIKVATRNKTALGFYKCEDGYFYTNYDLDAFDLLQKPYTIVECYEYEKTATIFKDYVNFFEELKPSASDSCRKYIKLVQNTLWGALCSRNIETHFVNKNQTKKTELPIDSVIVDIRPTKNDNVMIETMKDNYYKTEWARVGPFITSRGRLLMQQLLHKHMDKIKYINTDGFVFCSGYAKNTPEDLAARTALKQDMATYGVSIGKGLGQLKVPHVGERCEVVSKNQKRFL